jgi:hypothetical protein
MATGFRRMPCCGWPASTHRAGQRPCDSSPALYQKKRGVAHTKPLQTETKFKTRSWPEIGSARAVESGRFRARSTSAGCPGALARWRRRRRRELKKAEQNFVPVLSEPNVIHSNTKCLGAQNPAYKHRRSYLIVTGAAGWGQPVRLLTPKVRF